MSVLLVWFCIVVLLRLTKEEEITTSEVPDKKNCTVPGPLVNQVFMLSKKNYRNKGFPSNNATKPGDMVKHRKIFVVSCTHGNFIMYGTDPFRESLSVRCEDGIWKPRVPQCYKCGVSTLNSEDTQTEGGLAKPGNFPWHGMIYQRVNGSWQARCSGTLISPTHVVTAAYCVTTSCTDCEPTPMEAEDVMVSLGSLHWEWNTTDGIKAKIENININEYYSGFSGNYANNIALLELETEVTVSNNVLPVCLDYRQEHLAELRYYKTLRGYVAGWNDMEDCTSGGVCNTYNDSLRFARTSIIDFNECYNATQAFKPSYFSRLTPDKFCSSDEAAMQRNFSGGGLTFIFDGVHYFYGIWQGARLKINEEEKQFYNIGAFTNVSFNIGWLNLELHNRQIFASSFPVPTFVNDSGSIFEEIKLSG